MTLPGFTYRCSRIQIKSSMSTQTHCSNPVHPYHYYCRCLVLTNHAVPSSCRLILPSLQPTFSVGAHRMPGAPWTRGRSRRNRMADRLEDGVSPSGLSGVDSCLNSTLLFHSLIQQTPRALVWWVCCLSSLPPCYSLWHRCKVWRPWWPC